MLKVKISNWIFLFATILIPIGLLSYAVSPEVISWPRLVAAIIGLFGLSLVIELFSKKDLL